MATRRCALEVAAAGIYNWGLDFQRLLIATRAGLYECGRPEPVLAGRAIDCVAASGGRAWATGGRSLWAFGDEGWREAAPAGEDLKCVAATTAGVLAGTAGAHLLALRDDRLLLVEAFESVAGREHWYTPWGGPPDVRSVAGDGAYVYVNVHVGGILKSADRGASWTPTIDIHADVHEVCAPGAEVVVAATARGLARSTDGGRTWSFHTDGLHAAYARAVAVADGTLFLSASEGPRGGRAALYRTDADAPGRFERCSEFFEGNIDTGCIATEGGAAAFGTPDGRIFGTDHAAESWNLVRRGLPAVRRLAPGP